MDPQEVRRTLEVELEELAKHSREGKGLSKWSVYEGTLGIALLFYRLFRCRVVETRETQGAFSAGRCMEEATRLLSIARRQAKNHSRGHNYTFLCGTGGLHALQAVLWRVSHPMCPKPRADRAKRALGRLLDSAAAAARDTPACELLTGRAGALHAVLFVRSQLESGMHCIALEERETLMLRNAEKALTESILSSGVEYVKANGLQAPLMYEWHGSMYLGAAHGVAGIAQQLLNAPGLDTVQMALVTDSVKHLMSKRFPSGNLMSREDASRDRLVQWCHGAPALSLVCLRLHRRILEARKESLAEEQQQQMQSAKAALVAAVESSDVVWRRGMLRKGLGMCHGIAGNAMVFLALWEVTRDRKQLLRACRFFEAALHGQHSADLRAAPDYPSSLMNGMAGMLWFGEELCKSLEAEAEDRPRLVPFAFPGLDP